MPTIIGHTTRVINTIEKHAAQLVVVPFNKAGNLVLPNRLSRQLHNQIVHELWRWRHSTAWEYIDTIHKNLFHDCYELALSF